MPRRKPPRAVAAAGAGKGRGNGHPATAAGERAPAPRSIEAALRERVKELTCLYGIAELASKPGVGLEKLLRGMLSLLLPAWQYPEVCVARIVLDGQAYDSPGFRESAWRQSAEIALDGKSRGRIEVAYLEKKPDLDEGPFLKEERNLIDAVARQVALILERRKAEEDRIRILEQLRHADRLATIGVLAAEVAHEINEPLGSILGFAQLLKKCPRLPAPALEDARKIEKASLHARTVIRRLLGFARQMPPRKVPVLLNQVVEEALGFFADRCAQKGVDLARSLAPDLPPITADPAQLHQVLVNLVLNALQAMPNGGRLTVATSIRDGRISLAVEDTGIGMSRKVMDAMFVPFFTTKDAGEGTGLGLPVVHGIVTAHGGTIRVESQAGKGTRVEIRIPVPGTLGR